MSIYVVSVCIGLQWCTMVGLGSHGVGGNGVTSSMW